MLRKDANQKNQFSRYECGVIKHDRKPEYFVQYKTNSSKNLANGHLAMFKGEAFFLHGTKCSTLRYSDALMSRPLVTYK